VSSRLEWVVVAGLFVAEHDPPDVVGDPAFEAAHGFPGGLALGEFAPEVVVAGAARGANLDQGDDVQRVVELAVTGAGQAVPGALSAGDLDRGRSGVAGEMRRRGKPRRPNP
jgi:hypothetical protein